MKTRHASVALVFAGLATLAFACSPRTTPTDAPASSAARTSNLAPSSSIGASAGSAHEKKLNARFPDFGFMVSPAEYKAKYASEPVFKLKTDFPLEKPRRLPAF